MCKTIKVEVNPTKIDDLDQELKKVCNSRSESLGFKQKKEILTKLRTLTNEILDERNKIIDTEVMELNLESWEGIKFQLDNKMENIINYSIYTQNKLINSYWK
ncbi:MAG: hypothetical protein RSD13_06140 [Clostridium sp.]